MALNNHPFAAAALATAGAVYLSHKYDIAYLYRSAVMTLMLSSPEKLPPQQAAHRFLQWFVLDENNNNRVSTRDLDFNWHMSNSKYARHADFARSKLFLRTGFWEAIQHAGCNLVVSGMSQKFRRELANGQVYQIWARFVGWDDRHFYVEQIFTYHEKDDESSRVDLLACNKHSNNSKPLIYNGSVEPVKEAMNLQQQLFLNHTNLVVANIMSVRLTTTRDDEGRIVTPATVLNQMNMQGLLPSVIEPPAPIQEWSNGLDITANRLISSKPLVMSRL